MQATVATNNKKNRYDFKIWRIFNVILERLCSVYLSKTGAGFSAWYNCNYQKYKLCRINVES